MLLILRRLPQQLVTRQRFTFATENSNIIKLQKETDWKDLVLDSKTPVVVDFFATWCGPCKRLAPLLEKQAQAHKDKVNLVLVDIDEHQNLAIENQIQAVPVVKLFIKGKPADEFIGLPSTDRIKELFNKAVNST